MDSDSNVGRPSGSDGQSDDIASDVCSAESGARADLVDVTGGDADGGAGRREKVVVHFGYPLWRKHLLVAAARASQLQEQGHDVLVSYCSSRAGTCAVNYSGNPLTCQVCQRRARTTAESAGLPVVALGDSVGSDPELPVTWQDRRDLAEGVQSGITTTFRTMAGEVSRHSAIGRIGKRYYRTALGLLQALDDLVRRHNPDRLEVFNGRHACSRFCLAVARRRSVAFSTMEVTTRQRPIVFHGHTAHDRKAIQKRILQQPVDYQVASEFYDGRRKPRDNKFARKHSSHFEPPDASGYKKKVSIFLSSQDEFESLGKEWVSPFLDYAPIVEEACRENPDYLFCVRFHPNQADIVGDVTRPFERVAALPNVRIYEPTDTANTYTLVDWSDVVVTFGSSVTIEACWVGKPAIMLGPSLYDDLKISHNPQTRPDFLALLRRDLSPGSKDNAARFAWFEEFDQEEMRHVKCDGRTLKSNGLRISHPWLGQLMRTSDDLYCRAVKFLTGFSVRARP